MSKSYAKELLSFIQKSPSVFHVVENIRQELLEQDYLPLSEGENWNLVPGGRYFVTRNRSSIIAFQLPAEGLKGFHITASHSDSPSFKLKDHPEIETKGKYIQLNTEKYGGPVLSTWMDRPLSIAGRVLVRERDGLRTRLVNLDRDLVLIPNLAPHMNRELAEGCKLKMTSDLLPLLGDGDTAGRIDQLVAQAAGVEPKDILGQDLFLYTRVQPSLWGENQEGEAAYLSSPKLDDLECAYTTLQGFLGAQPNHHAAVYCVFDNEEVGSSTKQGADSTFLSATLERINHALGRSPAELHTAAANSFMLSCDNAHALHPNQPSYFDQNNCPLMNQGVVIKFNANQKYTSDAVSAAVFRALCDKAGVPCQSYANRSDLPGGSTLGNIANTHISLNTVDIGLAQLAMHSSYETAGVKDVEYMVRLCKEFFSASVELLEDGNYRLS